MKAYHPNSRFVSINRVNYHYLDFPADGPAVFLLHGLGSSTYSWEELAPHLLDAGFQVYALDLKGFGWSDKPAGAAYDLFTLRDEIFLWLENRGLKEIIFVGNSLGGSLGLLLALEQPGRIRSLVLIDAAAYLGRLPWVFRLGRLPWAVALSKLIFRKWVIRLAMKQAFYDRSRVTDDRVNAYYERLRSPGCLEAQIALICSLDFQRMAAWTERISEITVPTLLIWGEKDPWVGLSVGRKLHRNLPNSTLQVIPRCGHAPEEEVPEETARLIIEWLKQG